MKKVDIIQKSAQALYNALRKGKPIDAITDTHEDLTIDQAYEISLAVYASVKLTVKGILEKRLALPQRL